MLRIRTNIEIIDKDYERTSELQRALDRAQLTSRKYKAKVAKVSSEKAKISDLLKAMEGSRLDIAAIHQGLGRIEGIVQREVLTFSVCFLHYARAKPQLTLGDIVSRKCREHYLEHPEPRSTSIDLCLLRHQGPLLRLPFDRHKRQPLVILPMTIDHRTMGSWSEAPICFTSYRTTMVTTQDQSPSLAFRHRSLVRRADNLSIRCMKPIVIFPHCRTR